MGLASRLCGMVERAWKGWKELSVLLEDFQFAWVEQGVSYERVE